jgi:hypothetical protein
LIGRRKAASDVVRRPGVLWAKNKKAANPLTKEIMIAWLAD